MRDHPFSFEFSAQLQDATTKLAVAINKAKELWIERCLRIVLPDVTVDNAKEGKDWRYFTDLCKTEGIRIEENPGTELQARATRFMLGETEISRFVIGTGPGFYVNAYGVGAI
jgi:hypothetical protein